jgi:hypothetical protein
MVHDAVFDGCSVRPPNWSLKLLKASVCCVPFVIQ